MKTENNKISKTRETLLDAAFIEVYFNGYYAASTSQILKDTKIPKGSMYHYFPSKKDLVLSVIKERLFPKMDIYFDFSPKKNTNVYDTIKEVFIKISQNEILINNGCPLHRLIVEMSSSDKDFDVLLNSYYLKFIQNIEILLNLAIQNNEFKDFDTHSFAKYIISATWGALSLSKENSSKKEFEVFYKIILDQIAMYKI